MCQQQTKQHMTRRLSWNNAYRTNYSHKNSCQRISTQSQVHADTLSHLLGQNSIVD